MTFKTIKYGLRGAALATAAIAAWRRLVPRFRVEGPHYDVEGRKLGIELRRYAPRLVAETTVEGGYRGSVVTGFRRLAGFIFGGNVPGRKVAMTTPVELRSGRKIAMTAPVEARPAAEAARGRAEWLVTFTMPAGYGPDSLPRPVDPRVRIAERPAQRMAALRFSGRATRKRAERKARTLLGRMDRLGWKGEGPLVIARYDPPWTPWFLRRNEILVPLGG